jgi:hypothetical protein
MMREFGLRGARVAFTGTLASMTQREAWDRVIDAGALPQEHVGRRLTMLVVGAAGWPLLPDGTVSRKLQRAEALNKQGARIEIVPESVFLERLRLKAEQAQMTKTHPADVVCRLLDIAPETLERWVQFGLVRPQDGRYDFQDLVSLRTLLALVHQGVRVDTVSRSLQALAAVLPGTERPLAQLRIVAEHPKVLVFDIGRHRMEPSGQLVMNFAPESAAGSVAPLPEAPANEPAEQPATTGKRAGRAGAT